MYENYSRKVAYYKKINGIRKRYSDGTFTQADRHFSFIETERVKYGFSLQLWAWLEANI